MVRILYEDNFIVVAVKPSGLVSECGNGSFPDVLLPALAEKRAARGNNTPPELFCVHRLDRETEGIMVYALSAASAAALSKQIQEDTWQKIYSAILTSAPSEDSGRLCDLLYYDRSKGRSFTVDRMRKGVKEAELDYTVLSRSSSNSRCLVKIRLGTGRTHQIRVQFASRRMPLCGDRRYGAPASSGKQLALCACELSFAHPKSGEALSFKIDAPEYFSEFLS